MVSHTIRALRNSDQSNSFVCCIRCGKDVLRFDLFHMQTRLLTLAAASFLVVLSLAACRGLPAGPSLSNVTVGSLTLESTLGNPGLCCCRVVGTVANDNDVSIHATLKIDALDDRGESMARILHVVPDLEPHSSRAIDAHGFIFPCAAISQLKTEVDVKGITYPPL